MLRTIQIGLGLALIAQAAQAQDPGNEPSTVVPVPGTPPAPTEPDVDLAVPQRPTLAPQEMLSQSRDYVNRIQEVLANMQALQERARKDKDIILLNCVTEKLVQAKANLTIAEQALNALQESVARNDEGGSMHQFTRITIVHQKAQVLWAEAQGCVGEDLTFVGETQVEVEEPPNLPDLDQPSPPVRPVVGPPPAASSFL